MNITSKQNCVTAVCFNFAKTTDLLIKHTHRDVPNVVALLIHLLIISSYMPVTHENQHLIVLMQNNMINSSWIVSPQPGL